MTKEFNNKTYDNDTIYFMGKEPILHHIIGNNFTTYALVLICSFTKQHLVPNSSNMIPQALLTDLDQNIKATT